jgi:sugar/nucleoside kinase (ribokinase family)
VIVLGDLALDVVLAPSEPLKRGTDVPGHVTFRQGGSAATTARWFAALGSQTSLVTAVADDGLGASLVAYLESRRVLVHAVRVRGRRTGVLGVLVEDGDRTFVADRDAIYRLAPRHMQRSWFDGATLFHLPAYSLVGDLLASTSAHAARLAKQEGALVSVDLSSAGFLASEGPGLMLRRVAALSPDVLFATRSEAVAATADRGLDPLLDLAPLVIVKGGAAGASAYVRGGRAVVELRARALPATDTTGAGDAFDAGFLAAFATTVEDPPNPEDRDLRRALAAGHQAARRELTRKRDELAIAGLTTRNTRVSPHHSRTGTI